MKVDFSKRMSITLINNRGEYVSYSKQFNDERHFNNWIDLMARHGYKQIGVHQ